VAKAETSVANMESGNSSLSKVAAWPEKVRDYIDDLKGEMRKVSWPSWSQVRATTAVVIAAVFAFALYFAVVDMLMGRAIKRVFDTFAK
jgi:preprotein translocase subunit SecE